MHEYNIFILFLNECKVRFFVGFFLVISLKAGYREHMQARSTVAER
jgi:hypothetical protein